MLVLKEFRIDKDADEFLCVSGEESGWLATLLKWIGMGPVTALRCGRDILKFVSSGIRKGNRSVSVPASAVTAVVAGFSKPFELLVGAVFSAIISVACLITAYFVGFDEDGAGFLIGAFIVFAIICSVAATQYKKSAFLQISVYTGGDLPIIAMRVKRSVVNGVTVDLEKFQNAADLLSDRVIESRSCVINRREVS